MSTAVQQPNQSYLRRNHGRNQPDWHAFYANGYPSEVIVISDDEDSGHPDPKVVASSGSGSNYRIGSGAPMLNYNQEIPHPASHQHHHNDSSSSTTSSSSFSSTTAMTVSTTAASSVTDTSKYMKTAGKQPTIALPDSSKRLRKYSSSGTYSENGRMVEDHPQSYGNNQGHLQGGYSQAHYYNESYHDVPFDDDYDYQYDEDDSPYCTEYSMIESTESITSGSINVTGAAVSSVPGAVVPITATARSSLTRTSSSIASNGLLATTSNSQATSSGTAYKKKRKRITTKSGKSSNSGGIPMSGTFNTGAEVAYQPYPTRLLTPPSPMQIVKPTDVEVRPVIDRVHNPDPCDDKDGHFVVETNTCFADNRYQILKLLGQGTFGKVVSVYDKKTKTHRAIKIIRAVEKYREASRIELRVLMTLAMYDEHNIHQCIHLRDCFDYRNHICIVTDLLGISIFDFMKANNFIPFPGSHVQSFAYQLLKSVAFLHSLNLVHTDLKPENILLTNSESRSMPYRKGRSSKKRNVLSSTTINLIDFGSAIFNDEHHSSVVSTRHYRAPEIILGIGWSFPCDVWSIGCILVELCTGEALFQTHDNLEHLALMEKVIGEKLDPAVIQRIPTKSQTRAEIINKHTNTINYPNDSVDQASVKYVNSVRTFDHLVQSSVPYYSRDKAFWNSFLDLLHQIFVYDANNRITALEALNHPWFQKVINDDGCSSHLQHRHEYQPSYVGMGVSKSSSSSSASTATPSSSSSRHNRRQRL
ncbi:serine/threonine protein kinase KNS1 [Sugiyamaella lignohabitans]|uniref:Serine/threonine protein kinase KNS1 n=1 Tax=Sugiyamaella lignohabitans TaxID=796027 RepID=A0A167DKI0_9ASCO|nr:serine/threonine protein kinase KNS1 [Sugiyamaella lignohabitans]ANB13013.1 serine/threonine protein kinase KNS1 [Sugiyamaella lignohabitans]